MGGRTRDPWFEELVASHQDRLVRFVAGMLGDEQYALDIAQETFVAAWSARQQLAAPFSADRDEIGARRWLYRVAYNRAVSQLRHRRRVSLSSLEAMHDADETTFYAPTPFEDRVAEADAMRGVLADMEPDDVAAVLLHVVHSFTAAEIAQILDVTQAAATKRIWRAKERLRAAYFSQQARRASVQEQV